MEASLKEIDDLIVHEKMQAALEYQTEAWADGRADGIEAGAPCVVGVALLRGIAAIVVVQKP